MDIAGLVVGIASLFISCIDAFKYFQAARSLPENVQILLVKLDIEKARLLIWGNEIGILRENNRHSILDSSQHLDLFKGLLEAIQGLLTGSEQLRTKYGLQTEKTSDVPLGSSLDYLSSKSMGTFRDAARAFCVRTVRNAKYASQLLRGKRSGVGFVARAKWAIYDETKFRGLIGELKELVDGLYVLHLPGMLQFKNAVDEVVVVHINSVLEVSKLAQIEEATKDSYPM